MARRVLILLTLAAVVGLAVQAPAEPDVPDPTAGSGCPPGLVNAARALPSSTATVTCLGWPPQPFEEGAALASVQVRDRHPQLGEPCRDVHYYRVTFNRIAGEVRGTFAIFGGASHGSMIVPAAQVTMLDSSDAYVTDVQLGSYEQSNEDHRVSLQCVITHTYRFYCPATRKVDEVCYTWVPRRSIRSPTSAARSPCPSAGQ